MMNTKGCVQLTSNDTYFCDRCFIGVKMSEEAMSKGVDYFGPVNIIGNYRVINLFLTW